LKTDYLIIGSGIAGLTYALKIANQDCNRRVLILTKSDADESNTKYAQGGIAAVWNNSEDSTAQHVEDTLIAGDGLCDPKIVRQVVEEGPALLKELMDWGAKFDHGKSGKLSLGLEGGHSANRIVHHKDTTGFEIERMLLKRIKKCKNITLLTDYFAIDLMTDSQVESRTSKTQVSCFGAYVFSKKDNAVIKCEAKITLLATGGIGEVYSNTTNPSIATGDGIAMAYRAKADVVSMEFIQFHPTALYSPIKRPSFLISEAVRGFGAILRTKDGDAFMEKYDERKELAPRDIVSRAIVSELKKNEKSFVYLDCRHLNQATFKNNFPNIWKNCRDAGIRLEEGMIPVVPAAHYLCGGIKTNEWGQTTIKNLFACGECASTGLHGANRLASNSLLEALVFANRCFLKSIQLFQNSRRTVEFPNLKLENNGIQIDESSFKKMRLELQQMMNDHLNILRSTPSLEKAEQQLMRLEKEINYLYENCEVSNQLLELRNMIAISGLIVSQSLNRKVNKGAFFNVDLTESNTI
jgi:L-aspartate oxidase